MFKHQLQANRFELKYVVSEACAAAVRNYVRSYLAADEFNPPEGGGYPVHSLYLDSPGLELCDATAQGLKNRFKLRVRFYDDAPNSPVFFEIKRRANDAILKERANVRRSAFPKLYAGHWPTHEDLQKFTPKSFESLHHFCRLRHQLEGRGQVIVSYLREAFVTPDSDSVRITFDRALKTVPFRGELRVSDRTDWVRPKLTGVVLELKFTERFPLWMRDMARIFELQRCSMPKYVECVNSLGLTGGGIAWRNGGGRCPIGMP